MSSFDECGVLIPAATLEDFPSDLSDYDARSLLAAWTVLWHPRLLTGCGQIPTWYRADSPPEPTGACILTVPHPSLDQLPGGYRERFSGNEGCRWITGSDRQEMLKGLSLEECSPVIGRSRTLCVDDFYAVGFAVLQVQVMTRRLRYTSNLDEIHLQNRVVSAAEAFLAGDADTAITAMHDVFDCLAEERDHYFSSDPHLIDLTLASESTVEALLSIDDFSGSHASGNATGEEAPSSSDQESSLEAGARQAAPLPTPLNVLIDHEVAQAIGNMEETRIAPLRAALASGELGWAGGGPPSEACLDAMTFQQAEAVFRDAHRDTERALGTKPSVYGRFSGSTPSDLTETLVRLGYDGLIPLDFAGGTGFGDEAKVILRAGGAEIESLTAKPIDASGDSGFLTLGPRLGEAIDSGEIATALLAHWPGKACDSHHDLRRVASWSLALGKFWKLDDYFRDGEHPYHHGSSRAASADAHGLLDQQVADGKVDPLQSASDSFREVITTETEKLLGGLAALLGDKDQKDQGDATGSEPATAFAAAVGQTKSEGSDAVLLLNPHGIGCRQTIRVSGNVGKSAEHIYRVTRDGSSTLVTADAPAFGFAVVGGASDRSTGFSIGKMLGIGKPKPIAEQHALANEFMEVSISAESGGISGVYSGGARGNRFSLRLVRGPGDDTKTVMRCRQVRVAESNPAIGTIECDGDLLVDDAVIATFQLRYTLKSGSRVLTVAGELTPTESLGPNAWTDYIAARAAVANESASCRILLRDKLHRPRGRRLVCPLGVVLDEAERQTLISGQGLPYHRRVGDRFLDTLLAVRGESNPRFELNYGFDISNPVAASKAMICPPTSVSIAPPRGDASLGWLIHTAPKDVVLTDLDVRRRQDGRLAAIVRVVQTKSKSCSAALRFIHEVEHAQLIESVTHDAHEQAFGEEEQPGKLQCKGDRVTVPLASHQIADVLVVFAQV